VGWGGVGGICQDNPETRPCPPPHTHPSPPAPPQDTPDPRQSPVPPYSCRSGISVVLRTRTEDGAGLAPFRITRLRKKDAGPMQVAHVACMEQVGGGGL
jgi:hypothetical protein